MNIKIKNNFFFKLPIVFILTIFLSKFSLKAQDLSFTNEQMQEDYNYLIQIIDSVYAKQLIYDNITGRNFKSECNQLAPEMNRIKSNGEFVNLIQKTLNLTADAHSAVCSGSSLTELIKCLPENEKNGLLKYVDTSRIEESKKRMREYYKYRSAVSDSFQFYLYSTYLNGEYYNLIPFKENGVYVEKGAKIVKIDGVNIHKWVNNHLTDYSFINYDKLNSRYYANLFFYATSFFKEKKTVDISFQNSSNEKITIKFNLSKRPDFINERKLSINLTKVKFFRKDKVLYIRLSSMSEIDIYLKKIKKHAIKNIKRIVIDIRANYGGSDLVWKKIIEELIDSTVNLKLNVLVKNTEMVKEYLNVDKKNMFFFKDKSYLRLDMNELERFNPSSTSLRFPKKIIVLQDKNIFSSAGSFSSVAGYSDKFITIGTSADKVIGVGITPFYFMLPNTGILFQIDPTIDVTKANSYFDLLNFVNIPIGETIHSKYIWQKKNGNRWKHKFLSKHDPFYQKALKINID